MKYLLSVIFFLVISKLYSQESKISDLIINYQFKYLKDSTNNYSVNDDIMTLEIYKDRSIFYSHLKKNGDSLLKSDIAKGVDMTTLLANKIRYNGSKISYMLAKNKFDNKFFFTDKIMNNVYGYIEDIPVISWKISEEKQSVLNYSVQKATARFAGRNYIAWFTNTIPILEGPYKFGGLPGLILKIEDEKKNFIFEAISIVKNKEKIELPYEKFILITKEKYSQLKEQSVKNIVQFLNSTTEVKISPTNSLKKIVEKPYNPIELNK